MEETSSNSHRQEVNQERVLQSRPYVLWRAATAGSLAVAFVLALSAHHLSSRLSELENSTRTELAKLNQQVAQTADENTQGLQAIAREAHESAAAASAEATSTIRKTNAALSARLAQQNASQQQTQQQVAGEIDQLKQASTTASAKLGEIDADVTGVKSNLDSTQFELRATGSELKRVNGDMGVMSDRVATNAKELAELRALGERDYLEFDLKRGVGLQRVGAIQLALDKADVKRNRFTMDVLADDKRIQKRDRTVNEPVQFYASGDRQPCEIVVNEVKKDEVVGYLAVPKVRIARR